MQGAQLVALKSYPSNNMNQTLSFSSGASGVQVTSYASQATVTQANIKVRSDHRGPIAAVVHALPAACKAGPLCPDFHLSEAPSSHLWSLP